MKNKKAFYFTIIVLFCVILLLLLSFQIKRQYSSDSIRTRILVTNNFIKGIERDASRAMYISGYRTMVAVINYIASEYKYIDDPDINEVFADALFNGSLNYTLNFPGSVGILANTTITDWQITTSLLADTTNLQLNFSEINASQVNVTQVDPWHMIVILPIVYNITDPVSGVTWYRNVSINASLPIINTFEDPLYIMKFGSPCANKILKNEYIPLLEGDACNGGNLTIFLNTPGVGSMYINSTRAPSYLKRLKGDLTEDPNGIESIVNPLECETANNPTSTVVDFKYGDTATRRLTGPSTPTWIILTDNDVGAYEQYGLIPLLGGCSMPIA